MQEIDAVPIKVVQVDIVRDSEDGGPLIVFQAACANDDHAECKSEQEWYCLDPFAAAAFAARLLLLAGRADREASRAAVDKVGQENGIDVAQARATAEMMARTTPSDN